MMKALHLLACVAAFSACQPSSHQEAAKTPKESLALAAIPRAKASPLPKPAAEEHKQVASPDDMPPIPVRFGEVLRTDIQSQPVTDTAEIKRFFSAHNLCPLLQTVDNRPDDYAMNGFRGPDQYRTEVVVTSARRKPQNPFAYELRGMTRTKRHIRHFQGEVVFDALSVEPLLTAQDKKDIANWTMVQLVSLDNDSTVKRFAVAGTVRLAEDKTSAQAGAFQGRLVMELGLTWKGRLYLDAPFLHGPSQGGDQKYAGTWTTYRTGQSSPSVWVRSITGYGPFIYSDFVIGERDVDINPKYAKLGWNNYWENDEWWAASPKPKLNL